MTEQWPHAASLLRGFAAPRPRAGFGRKGAVCGESGRGSRRSRGTGAAPPPARHSIRTFKPKRQRPGAEDTAAAGNAPPLSEEQVWGGVASRAASTSRGGGGGARAAPSAAGVAPPPASQPLAARQTVNGASAAAQGAVGGPCPPTWPSCPAEASWRHHERTGPALPPPSATATASDSRSGRGARHGAGRGPAPEAAVPPERGCPRHPAPRAREGAERRGEGTTQAATAAEPRAGPCADPTPSRPVPRGPAPRRGRVITSRRGGGGLGGVPHVIRGPEPGAAGGARGIAGRGGAQEERS